MKKKMVISVSEKTFPCPGFAIGIFKEERECGQFKKKNNVKKKSFKS